MFPGQRSRPAASESPLNTILNSPALRLEYALLIFVCIDCMRKNVAANFDGISGTSHEASSATSSRSRAGFPRADYHEQDAPPPYTEPPSTEMNLIDLDESSVEELSINIGRGPGSGNQRHPRPMKAYEQWDRQQSQDRLREALSAPDVQGLRRAALTFFDKWRMSVLRRTGTTLNVLGDMVRKEKANRDARGTYKQLRPSRVPGYPAIPNHLTRLNAEQRSLLVQSGLLLLLGLENYPSHSRCLLLYLTASLDLATSELTGHEKSTAKVLLSSTVSSAMQSPSPSSSGEKPQPSGISWKMGLAAVGGAALIGVTGGLAAPLIAGGLGVIFGPVMGAMGLGGLASLLGALIGNSVLVGTLFGIYGAKRMGDVVEKFAKDIEDFQLLPLKRTSTTEQIELGASADQKQGTPATEVVEIPVERLHVTICVSGALRSMEDIRTPWEVLSDSSTLYALQFEPTALLTLGEQIASLVSSTAFATASYLVLRNTAFATLMAGLYWPMGLLKSASVIDNPFNIALSRSGKAGVALARILMEKAQGERPVSLVGYGLGARVVWSCCQELARQNAFGLVSDAVMMGLPGPAVSEDERETDAALQWRRMRSVVNGRIVNCFSSQDWVLRLLYRVHTGLGGIAGNAAVHVPGVENEDVSDAAISHVGYAIASGQILQRVGFEVDEEAVHQQTEQAAEARRRDAINEERRGRDFESTGHTEREGKVKMVEERTGKIVMVDLESGAISEAANESSPAAAEPAVHMNSSGTANDSRKSVATPAIPAVEKPEQHEAACESESDAGDAEMSVMAPEAMPDPEPVTFGSENEGLRMTWDG